MFIYVYMNMVYIQAQSMDSIQCEEYFKRLDTPNDLIIWKWEQAPALKASNLDILDSLCNILTCYELDYFYAIYVIDDTGMPLCCKLNIEIDSDSLKTSITSLLSKIIFTPAYIVNNEPVISDYLLIINPRNCNKNFYLSKRRKKK